jgi:hypothetical protein
VFPCCCLSCVCKNLDVCNVLFMDMQVLFIPWFYAGFCEWLVVMLIMLSVELDHWLLVLALLLPVACPAPPCAWLPTLPALHLLGAWPTPCFFWSWLSNHVALALAMGFDWWGEFPLMLSSWAERTWFCAGAGVVLWCCGSWCCGCCGAVVAVVLVD